MLLTKQPMTKAKYTVSRSEVSVMRTGLNCTETRRLGGTQTPTLHMHPAGTTCKQSLQVTCEPGHLVCTPEPLCEAQQPNRPAALRTRHTLANMTNMQAAAEILHFGNQTGHPDSKQMTQTCDRWYRTGDCL